MDFSDPPFPSQSPHWGAPSPGDRFRVPGRTELLVVAQLIAAFEIREKSLFIVETPTGERWILAEREMGDGPRWIGRADTSGQRNE
jgi:hypothetical protein